MVAFLRWRFYDPYSAEEYVFPLNPNTMSTPFGERPITALTSTAVGGQTLAWEGAKLPADWSFGGVILNAAHYEALRSWTYDRKGRIVVSDHFGRNYTTVLRSFKPEPKRSISRYWRHDYTIDALVFGAPSAPTILEVPA